MKRSTTVAVVTLCLVGCATRDLTFPPGERGLRFKVATSRGEVVANVVIQTVNQMPTELYEPNSGIHYGGGCVVSPSSHPANVVVASWAPKACATVTQFQGRDVVHVHAGNGFDMVLDSKCGQGILLDRRSSRMFFVTRDKK